MMGISYYLGFFLGGAFIGGIIPWVIAKRKGRTGIGCASFLFCGLAGFINPLLSVGVGVVFLIAAIKAKDETVEEAALDCPYSDIERQIPQSVKDFCREHAGDTAKLESYLQECKNQRVIKGSYVGVILKEFSEAPTNPLDGETVVNFENLSKQEPQTISKETDDQPKAEPVKAEPVKVEPVKPEPQKADVVAALITCPVCGRRQSGGHTHCAVCQADLRVQPEKKKPEPQQKTEPPKKVQPEKTVETRKPDAQKEPSAKPAMTKEQLQQLQAAVNDNYPGMMMFVRDANLPASLTARYKAGSIIRERAYADASSRIGGVGTSHRYVILSNHMVNYGYFAKDAAWQHYAAARDSRFKVLGTHMCQGKTAIILLHLPDSEAWKLFRNVEVDVDAQYLADSIRYFEQCCAQQPISEMMDEEWLSRCAFPLGMDEQGHLWELD